MKFKGNLVGKNARRAVEDYRRLAGLNEDAEITDIDEWALKTACNRHSATEESVKEALLGESMQLKEDAVEKAAKELDAEVSEAEDKTELEKELDFCLRRAKFIQARTQKGRRTADYPNLLIEGSAGFGKSAIVSQWAAKNGVNLFTLLASTAGPENVGGIISYNPEDPDFAKVLGNKDLLDALSRPNSVLFLDEYNRAKSSIRATLLTLVNNHTLPSGRGQEFLPNLLFTVAAVNPVSSAYGGVNAADMAELTRYKRYSVTPNVKEHLRYLNKEYDEEYEDAQEFGDTDAMRAALGKKALASTILTSPLFEYTSLEEEEEHVGDPSFRATNYRTLKLALDESDGKKDELLRNWSSICAYTQKPIIEDILGNYVDVDDKANSVFKQGTNSAVFKKAANALSKVQTFLKNNT